MMKKGTEMQTFTFVRVQAGYWGRTVLAKTIKVKADHSWAAQAIVRARKDAHKHLRNGDYQCWELVVENEEI